MHQIESYMCITRTVIYSMQQEGYYLKIYRHDFWLKLFIHHYIVYVKTKRILYVLDYVSQRPVEVTYLNIPLLSWCALISPHTYCQLWGPICKACIKKTMYGRIQMDGIKLKDMYIQHFHNFRTDDINHNKCVIANTCVRSIYGRNKYLYQIHSPKIRTIFTKLRIDSNCA